MLLVKCENEYKHVLESTVPDLDEESPYAIPLGPSQSPTFTTRVRWKSA